MKDYFQVFETGVLLNPVGVSSEPLALATFLCLLHYLLSDHLLGCFSLHSLLRSFSHTIAAKTLLSFSMISCESSLSPTVSPKLLVFNGEIPLHPRPTMKTFPTQETKQPEPCSHFSIELCTRRVRNAHWVRLDLSPQLKFQPPILSPT